MKKQLVTIGIVVLLLAVGLSGCEELDTMFEESSTKIEVTVKASAQVRERNGTSMRPGVNRQVRFDISKTGGDSFTLYRTTNEQGYTDVAQVGYNLHEGQTINVIFSVTGVDSATSTRLLTWGVAEIYAKDGKYTWMTSTELITEAG